jgi:hypothetical protein
MTSTISTATPAPALPAIDAAPNPDLTAEQQFAAEAPDATWKASTERTLHDRLAKTWKIDCRTSQCQVEIAGNRQEVAHAIDQLQQLRDIARSVVLTRPDVGSDSNLVLHAYVKFERAD